MGHIQLMEARRIHSTKSKRHAYICGITKYSEFGVLEKVEHNDGWVTMYAEEGYVVHMKKIYTGWLHVYEKALKLIGKPIVYETGSSSSAADYYRDIYEDSPIKPMLRFPKDAGPSAQAQIILARAAASRRHTALEMLEEKAADGAAEAERLAAAVAVLEKKDYDEIAACAKQLDKEWDDWVANPHRKLLLQGAANHGGQVQQLDRKMMLRLGIDVTEKRRLAVKVIGRGKNNFVKVRLPHYQNTECELALKKSTQKGTRGEWGVASVDNLVPHWWTIEKEHYPRVKTYKMPMEEVRAAHVDIMSKVAEKMTHDIVEKVGGKYDPDTNSIELEGDGQTVTITLPGDHTVDVSTRANRDVAE